MRPSPLNCRINSRTDWVTCGSRPEVGSEQKDPWLVNERTCQRQFLLHAFGEAAGAIVAAIPQPDNFQILFHLPRNFLHAIELGEEFQVLCRGQTLVETRDFSRDSDRAADFLVGFADLETGDFRFPGAWPNQTGQHSRSCGFTCAVRPKQSEHFAGFDVERQAINGQLSVKLFGEISSMNHLFGGKYCLSMIAITT